MLKQGYDDFEITHIPPKVDVCDRKYMIDVAFDGDAKPSPTAACPPSTTPPSLLEARAEFDAQYQKAFHTAVARLKRRGKSQPATAVAASILPPAKQKSRKANRRGRRGCDGQATASAGNVPVPQPNPAGRLQRQVAQQPQKKHWWQAFTGERVLRASSSERTRL